MIRQAAYACKTDKFYGPEVYNICRPPVSFIQCYPTSQMMVFADRVQQCYILQISQMMVFVELLWFISGSTNAKVHMLKHTFLHILMSLSRF
jgi:hypothetical protein